MKASLGLIILMILLSSLTWLMPCNWHYCTPFFYWWFWCRISCWLRIIWKLASQNQQKQSYSPQKFSNPVQSVIIFKQLILVVTEYLVSQRCFYICWPMDLSLCIQIVFNRSLSFSFDKFLVWHQKMLFHLLMPCRLK